MANHKILIADHNSITLNMFSTVIQNIGIPRPVQATSGQLAIKEFKAQKIDISFIDFSLPDMSGLDVLREFKEIRKDAFVVMLCLEASEENIQAAIQAKVNGFLIKPFQPYSVIKLIHKYETQLVNKN
jgi:two-component system chemotaxis response regulator CheY